MGLNVNSLRFLLPGTGLGLSFDRVSTIGRQSVVLGRRDIGRLSRFFLACGAATCSRVCRGFAMPRLTVPVEAIDRLDRRMSSEKRLEQVALTAILAFALAVRVVSWWVHGFQGHEEGEFEAMGRLIATGDWQGYFAYNRAHQPVNAVLFVPRSLLNLDLAAYVLGLHAVLVCGTVYFVFRTSRTLFGPACGLISAFIIAADLMLAFWFPWTSGDIPFHFFVALFACSFVAFWDRPRRSALLAFALTGAACILTRPEGLFITAAATIILVFRSLASRLSAAKSLAVIAAGFVLCLALAFVLLSYNRPAREAFLSNMHVGYSLYVSTRMSTNSPQEQPQVYNDLGAVIEKATSRPEFVSPGYALSMEGLKFIREQPFRYAGMYVLRFASIVVPSAFSPWWSARNRLYSFSVSVLLFGGAALAWYFAGGQRLQTAGLLMMAIAIAFMISLFQRELDYRVPLSMHVLLSCSAPWGWLQLWRAGAGQLSRG